MDTYIINQHIYIQGHAHINSYIPPHTVKHRQENGVKPIIKARNITEKKGFYSSDSCITSLVKATIEIMKSCHCIQTHKFLSYQIDITFLFI